MTSTVEYDVASADADVFAYQTFFDVGSGSGLVTRVEAQLEAWLREREGWDPPTEESGYHVDGQGRELLVLHRSSNDGRDVRARLSEPSPLGTWTTTLTVHESRVDRSWIALRVVNEQGRFVKVPRLAGYLMDAIEVHDGEVWMSSEPRLVHARGIEEFAEELSCPNRQGLYLVAGTADDSPPLADHVRRVAAWTRQTVGLAQVAVLDPAATAAFAEIMGPDHRVPPGTIRTYRPEVDPAIPSDGRLHRILGAARLEGEPVGAVCDLLGRVARRHAAERPRPQRFAQVDQGLTRHEDRLVLAALAPPAVTAPEPLPAPRPAPEQASSVGQAATNYLAQIELVKAAFGIEEITAEKLDELARLRASAHAEVSAIDRVTLRLEERQRQVEELADKLAFYQELTDYHECDLYDAEAAVAKAAEENRWLRTRLRDLEAYEAAAAALPPEQETDYPSDFAELATRLADGCLAGVVFTGDLKQVRALEDHDPLGRIARTTWDALLTLADYVRARRTGRFDGGVKQYLNDTPAGFRNVPPAKFAEKETAATMQAFGAERSFPVPGSVDPSGSTTMETHFKLGRVGMISPRMYCLDDWTRTERVYVGYIGGHLRNTQTN